MKISAWFKKEPLIDEILRELSEIEKCVETELEKSPNLEKEKRERLEGLERRTNELRNGIGRIKNRIKTKEDAFIEKKKACENSYKCSFSTSEHKFKYLSWFFYISALNFALNKIIAHSAANFVLYLDNRNIRNMLTFIGNFAFMIIISILFVYYVFSFCNTVRKLIDIIEIKWKIYLNRKSESFKYDFQFPLFYFINKLMNIIFFSVLIFLQIFVFMLASSMPK